MIKKIVLSVCAIVALSTFVSAQRMPSLSLTVAGNKSTIASGDQVMMRVKGYNDETSTLQWQASSDGKSWKNIAKATGDIFETASLTENSFFRVVTRPNEGYLTIEEISNTQIVSIAGETATMVKKKQ